MEYHTSVSTIRNILKDKKVWFEEFHHEAVRTSEEAAAIRPGYTIEQGTKALIVRIKQNGAKKFIMIVVPGDKRFNSKSVKQIVDTSDIRFATKEEVSNVTHGVQLGGVPPFGNIFNLDVYAETSIFNNEKIIFNAGDKKVSIAMLSEDYKKIVNPNIVSIV